MSGSRENEFVFMSAVLFEDILPINYNMHRLFWSHRIQSPTRLCRLSYGAENENSCGVNVTPIAHFSNSIFRPCKLQRTTSYSNFTVYPGMALTTDVSLFFFFRSLS